MSTIKIKRSDTPNSVPAPEDLVLGELAVNTHDGKMFFKKDENGNIQVVDVGMPDRTDNVLYVSKTGDDTNSGDTIHDSFSTIDQALSVATNGTTIFVKSGDHTIDNSAGGVNVPSFVSIVGDNLRTTNIYGSNPDNDLFYVNNGSFITGVTFRGHQNGAAAVSFNPDGSAGAITTSPYVQNCSSITTTGVGMRVDGSYVSGLRSMVSDAFTQINFGGKGIHLLNMGYAQLVSIFTVSCDVAILAESGGTCSLTNSNCSFGNYGLKATGLGPNLYSGSIVSESLDQTSTVVVSGLSEKPKYGDAIQFNSEDFYYTVDEATDLVNGESTITLNETLTRVISPGETVDFFQRSLITASSITFEYVGTGIDVYSTPRSGAFPIQENEVIQDDNGAGKVYYTSTDQKGDFRIGGELTINRTTGTIEGNTFDRSLFAVLTPYILALED